MDEQKAVIRVCHSNPEGNVVQVFNHGWLHYNQYFFFDMERCDFSLHDYIEKSWPADTAKKVPNFLNRDALGPIAKLSQVCNIMSDISNGVAWIHACGHIHRDLCPKNGRTRKNLADVQFCILVSKSSGKLVTLVFQQTVRPILDHIQNVGGEPGFIANPHWLMGEQE
jgi:serine/threonine protein kinase